MALTKIAFSVFAVASGSQLVSRNASAAPRATEAQQACESACGPNADVTCYTDCEVEVYRCYDVHIGNGDGKEGDVYEECKKKVVTNYQSFVAHWNATALYAQGSNSSRKVQEKCSGACGASNSICRTACEVDMYECFDINTPKSEDKIETCQEDALKKHAGLVSFMLSNKSIAQAGNDECKAACKDSFCETQCEVGMYECFDTNTPKSEDKIAECQKAVVEKVKKEYASFVLSTHNLLVRHNSGDWKAHVVSVEDRHHARDECNAVCGIDAQCASSCEVEMYECFDTNTPVSEDKIKGCQDAALEKHKDFRVAALLAIKPKSFLASAI